MDIDTNYNEIQGQNIMEVRDRYNGYDYDTDVESIGEMELNTDLEESTEEEDNLGDLERLYNEATYMMKNNIIPTEGWYDDRYKYIYKYSHLNWDEMSSKFRNKDSLIYDLCVHTKMYIQDILDGYSGTPNFDFNTYYMIICNVLRLWKYYSNKYVGDETDIELVDLVESMSFLKA